MRKERKSQKYFLLVSEVAKRDYQSENNVKIPKGENSDLIRHNFIYCKAHAQQGNPINIIFFTYN